MKKFGKSATAMLVAVAVAMATVGAGCGPVITQTRGTRAADFPRVCEKGEKSPCFDTREAPAGGTRQERPSWCQDHGGLCAAAILLGIAAMAVGAGAAAGMFRGGAGASVVAPR